MKKILILFSLIAFAQAQYVEDLGVVWLFKTTAWEDSVSFETDSSYYYVKSTAAADTLISRRIANVPATGEIHVTGKLDSLAGTTNVKIYVGLYRGEGYPDYTGIEWKELKAYTGPGTFQYSIKGNSWSDDQVCSKFYIKILETVAQQNKYVIWFHILRKP